MKLKKNYKLGSSIRVKLLFIISLLTLVAIIVVTVAFYYMSNTQIVELVQQRNLQTAKVAAHIIEGEYIDNILEESDNGIVKYSELVNKFNEINEDLNLGQLYIIVKQNNSLYKVYISNEVEAFNAIDIDKNYKLPLKLLEMFKTGKDTIVSGYYKLDTIKVPYNSAFSAVFNNHEVIAIVGYDHKNEDLRITLQGINVDVIHIIIVLILICMIIQYFILAKVFTPIDELVDIIHMITKGDMTVHMQVKTLDEIGVVKQALNNNINTISAILNKIRVSSNHVNMASKSIFVSSKDGIDSFNELLKCTMEIANMAQIQKNDTYETMEILERLSEDGHNMFNNVQGANRVINKIQQILFKCNNKDDQTYKSFKEIVDELTELIINAEKYIEDMSEHIKQAFYKIDQTKQLAGNIERDTVSVVGIVDEQIANSEEFVNMANLLKNEARKVNETIKIFKIEG